MKAQMMKFWKDEEGATAIEYGLIAGLIAVAIIGSLVAVAGGLDGLFDRVIAGLNRGAEE